MGRACQNEEAFDQSKTPCFGAFDHDIASYIQITAQRQLKMKGRFFEPVQIVGLCMEKSTIFVGLFFIMFARN